MNKMPNDIPIFLNVEVNGVVGVDSVLEVDGVDVEGVLGAVDAFLDDRCRGSWIWTGRGIWNLL